MKLLDSHKKLLFERGNNPVFAFEKGNNPVLAENYIMPDIDKTNILTASINA